MKVRPDNPAGEFSLIEDFNDAVKVKMLEEIRIAPSRLRAAVSDLNLSQLDTLYKNWSIRQITHHIADSHLNSLIRFKWTLTEAQPTIKAYQEADWVQLADSRIGDLEPALLMLEGIHAKWVQLLNLMTEDQFGRAFLHPQSGAVVSLWEALNYYAWHGKHHTTQITWLREHVIES